ncbi:MAG: hypothetical protein VXZ99_17070, partial [Pseudomonadota bacterium]|nr:hypothetical protein [Pseudomonadota bacterium]
MSGEEHNHSLESPANVRKVIYALFVICAGLFVADWVYHKHPYFVAENVPGFYAIFGFVVCIVLIFVAKWARTILMRPEDYYDAD